MELSSIFIVLGGLGLLLYGMKMMSQGLEMVAGDSLQAILRRSTSNTFLAVIVGIIATIVLNSSTLVTIITVGFVNSKLLTLTQAIGVIMGANVGTTFSAQLIAFRIDTFAPLFVFIGIIMYMFFKTKAVKNIGYIILGFGILFFSIGIMGGPLRELARDPNFGSILETISNPLYALLVGMALTAITQSSSAIMGLLVAMQINFSLVSASYGIPNPLSFETSAFIILGTNVGNCVTTLLASIPASRDSKRAAIFHAAYSIIGALVFGILIKLFPVILDWFTSTWKDAARQVAMFHTLFNVATLFLLLPFVKWITILMQKIIPVKESEIQNTYEKKLIYLDDNTTMLSPTFAVANAHSEICRMGKIANENLDLALEAFFERSEDKANKAMENEKVINFLYHSISSKLVEINNKALSELDAEKVGKMFKILSDIERIGDHAENIAEYTISVKERNVKFSEAAMSELKLLGGLTSEVITKAMQVYKTENAAQIPEVERLEEEIDARTVEYTENHISRLKTESCEPKSGVLFTDILIDLERSADHAHNIAFFVLPARGTTKTQAGKLINLQGNFSLSSKAKSEQPKI